MRLIDADALKEAWVERLYVYIVNNGGDAFGAVKDKAALEFINEQPTIDAVPVVRCKDCKHWGMHKRLNVPWCFETHIDKSEDGFCDSGERRE